MTAIPDKAALHAELVALLRADLGVLERAHKAAREGATHEEAKPENDKDTRALEQSYLARGQALRLEELRAGVADVEGMVLRSFAQGQPVALGALVTAEDASDDDGGTRSLFLAPHGGGVALAGGRVQVVTPKSPLGQAILGKREGDACEIRLAGRVRELILVRIA